ncbi:single-stranded-DNA-specific exonuclease RecJ [Bacillus sp. FJAT-50079]|uniref:single-stranded-DNA-specific exonuclease RecJ n=1 Tax=Bacillus sp. FJAT-50079 TaxID=2833577 RepID=UPI001BCA1797|nr:single-stranded-DNA-specific exonuclease RecJ [Bacillus sp. FJAT-50079]MBS4208990.1 single-stranded-DNA-specific exonuclease RecJ [Bacillus sp. FJAT-50079]
MLLSKTRWVVKERNEEASKYIADTLNIAPLVATLLVNRGLDDVEAAKKFLYIENEPFHDPFLIEGMESGTKRIKEAIANQEPILIFGDYDADGVTSTSVLMMVLKEMGANVRYYIPNRFTEGYGPNAPAFRMAAETGIKLIVTVDTGISALEEATLAKELGIDLIITDHHEPGEQLPDAFAIIHPKLPGSRYPFQELAGVGVAFKLAHALMGEVPTHLLDLVAIGTIADLVPLHGENRLITKIGLKQLAVTERPGIQAICQIAGAKIAEVNEETIGFMLAPRLNAAGRLEHAGPAVELLMTNDEDEALQLAEELDLLNKERQSIVSTIANEAIQIVEKQYQSDDDHVLVIGKEGWNPGVIGIVASRLVEKFYRPAIVLSYDEETGLAKGSARSIQGFDLFENLSALSELLPHFGGHSMAAGMTLKLEDVDLLRIRLNERAKEQLTDDDYIPITELDAEITVEEASIETINQLNMLAPYGMKNPKPKVLIENTAISGMRKIGANQTHIKLTLEEPGHSLDGVGFHLGSIVDEIAQGSKISVIGELAINEWNNIRKPQIFLKDVAVNEWQLFDIRGNKQLKQWITSIDDANNVIVLFQKNHLDLFTWNDLLANTVVVENGIDAEQLVLDQKNVILLDFPPTMELVTKLVKGKRPARIYAHFYQKEDHFFSTLPTREHFKWYYAFLMKRKHFDLKRYGNDLAAYKGWSQATIEFMSNVFFELDFVTIDGGMISINLTKTKKDLAESPTYQRKQEQLKLEKDLLYSSYDQLKQWFDDRMAMNTCKEEELKQWI